MLHHVTTLAVDGVTLAYNPFSGVTPTFGPFGPLLTSKVGMFLGLAWVLGFSYTGYQLVIAISKASTAKKGGYGDNLDDAKRDLLFAAAATVGLASLPVIYGILATVK
ncbi:hypothetical protein [Streptomyces kronopolitis]|uniref:hypothetical protein n=1 Tax=Streptomyces kronopolitis TaxID=1612435 RepID=UPI003D967134